MQFFGEKNTEKQNPDLFINEFLGSTSKKYTLGIFISSAITFVQKDVVSEIE
jgi:hypothetical protein